MPGESKVMGFLRLKLCVTNMNVLLRHVVKENLERS